jgi:hypothetical protein
MGEILKALLKMKNVKFIIIYKEATRDFLCGNEFSELGKLVCFSRLVDMHNNDKGASLQCNVIMIRAVRNILRP